jgi:hypothetical protein
MTSPMMRFRASVGRPTPEIGKDFSAYAAHRSCNLLNQSARMKQLLLYDHNNNIMIVVRPSEHYLA